MARQMLEFLNLPRASQALRLASGRAAHIIVRQFKHDLLELGVVVQTIFLGPCW